MHSDRTEIKRDSHEKVFKNHDFCEVVAPNDKVKVLKYCHGAKSIKYPFVI